MKTTEAFCPNATNINLLWASLFIEELIRHDITDFCIAPGSRSTPLTLAVAKHNKAHAHVHFDERGLGFLALGLAQASQKPVVIITTSGTAVANLYPAVIEARQSGLPLIIVSADRPASLINCGANQAIEQHKIFAQYPAFFEQIVQPTTEIEANYLLTSIDNGLNTQQKQPAPIHFNIAFAEPLYPSNKVIDYQPYLSSLKKWTTNGLPFTRFIDSQSETIAESSQLTGKRVLIIAANMDSLAEAHALCRFSEKHHLPVFADIQSSQSATKNNLHYYDLVLINEAFQELLQQADIIIQFGEQLVSKRLTEFMTSFTGELQLVKRGETRIDPNHQLDIRYNCNAVEWIKAQKVAPSTLSQHWFESLQELHQEIAEGVISPFLVAQPFSEMSIINQLDKQISKDAPLFIGNSMPIRFADMLMNNNQAEVFTNRGASGIDGLLATAVGVAKNSQKTTTLLIGDSSFLYDLNSLALLAQLETTFIIIVINNDGGAIFNLLPVPEEQRTDFYQLPHGLNFKASCEQFCIDYHNPNQLIDFTDTYNQCLQRKHSLIEVTLENQQSATQLKQLKEQVKYATL